MLPELIYWNKETMLRILKVVLWTLLVGTTEPTDCGDEVIGCHRDTNDGMSFFEICRWLDDQFTCQARVLSDGCLDDHAVRDAQALGHASLVDNYGCTLPSGYEPDSGECNLRKLLQCYNPLYSVLESEGLSAVTANSSIQGVLDQLQVLFERLSNPIVVVGIQNILLSSVDDGDMRGIKECFTQEVAYCNDDLHTRVAAGDTTLLGLLRSLETAYEAAEGLLSPGCGNFWLKGLNLIGCVPVDASTLDDVLPDVADLYNRNLNSDDDCGIVTTIMECTRDHAGQCGPLLTYELHALGTASLYQMYSHCGDTTEVSFNPDTYSCSNDDRLNLERLQIASCGISASFSSDLQYCSLLKLQAKCMAASAVCCEVKYTDLVPLLHNWAMYNDLMGCNIKLDPDSTAVRIRPQGDSCDYSQVLGCLGDVFTAIGFELSIESELHYQDIIQLSSKLTALQQNETALCSAQTDINFGDIRRCLKDVFSQCELLPLCDYESLRGNDMNIKTLLVDLDNLESIMSTCNADCDLEGQIERLNECDRIHGGVSYHLHVIRLGEFTDTEFNSICSSLEDLSDCYNDSLGQCQFLINMVRRELYLHSNAVRRLTGNCGVTFGGIMYEATTTTTETTTEDDEIDGSEMHKAQAQTVVCLFAAVWSIIVLSRLG